MKAAARAILRPGGRAEAAADLVALLGCSEAEALAMLGPEAQPDVTLPLSLRPALRLFSASLGQWRTAGMSGVILGFDVTAVDVAARWLGLTPSPRLLSDLQAMEAEALTLLRSKP